MGKKKSYRCEQCKWFHLPPGAEKGMCWVDHPPNLIPAMAGNSACARFDKKPPRRKKIKREQLQIINDEGVIMPHRATINETNSRAILDEKEAE